MRERAHRRNLHLLAIHDHRAGSDGQAAAYEQLSARTFAGDPNVESTPSMHRTTLTNTILLTLSLSLAAFATNAADGYGIGGFNQSGSFQNNVQVSPNCSQTHGSGTTSITCTSGLVRCTTTYTGNSASTNCVRINVGSTHHGAYTPVQIPDFDEGLSAR